MKCSAEDLKYISHDSDQASDILSKGSSDDIIKFFLEDIDTTSAGYTSWRARSGDFIKALLAALLWCRDHHHLQLNPLIICHYFNIEHIVELVDGKWIDGNVISLPIDVADRLKGYLNGLPGSDLSKQAITERDRQHTFNMMWWILKLHRMARA